MTVPSGQTRLAEQAASACGAGGIVATAASMPALSRSFRERFVIFITFSFQKVLLLEGARRAQKRALGSRGVYGHGAGDGTLASLPTRRSIHSRMVSYAMGAWK